MVLGIGGLTIDPRLVRGMKEDLGEEPSSERMRKVGTSHLPGSSVQHLLRHLMQSV